MFEEDNDKGRRRERREYNPQDTDYSSSKFTRENTKRKRREEKLKAKQIKKLDTIQVTPVKEEKVA